MGERGADGETAVRMMRHARPGIIAATAERENKTNAHATRPTRSPVSCLLAVDERMRRRRYHRERHENHGDDPPAARMTRRAVLLACPHLMRPRRDARRHEGPRRRARRDEMGRGDEIAPAQARRDRMTRRPTPCFIRNGGGNRNKVGTRARDETPYALLYSTRGRGG